MGKDLENCEKVLKPELIIKSQKLDNLVLENLGIFTELKLLRIENESNNERLQELNESLMQAEKKKKKNWLLPTLVGLFGFGIGASL